MCLDSTDANGEVAPVILGQWVHAPVKFQARYYIQTFFVPFFLLMAKSCTLQLESLTRALILGVLMHTTNRDQH